MTKDNIQVRLEPLSDYERGKLEETVNNNKILFYVVSGIFCIPVVVLIYYRGDAAPAYMFGFVLGIVVVFSGLQLRKSQQDLQEGQKRVSTGFITEKRHETRTSSSGTGSSRTTTTTHYYYIYMGATKWDVGASHFQDLREGQKIAIKEAPNSGTILKIDILEDLAGAPKNALYKGDTAALDAQFDTFLSNPQQLGMAERINKQFAQPPTSSIVPFSEMEIALMKEKRNQLLYGKLIWPILGLVGCYYGSYLLIFIICLIFPIFTGKLWLLAYIATGALGAHFLRKRIKNYREYSAAIEANEVERQPIKIVDKIVSNYSRRLTLEDGQQLSVGEGAYSLVKVGETAYLRRVPSFGMNLTIEVPNGVCFPL